MAKKIFVTYGNANYYSSLDRIRKEAEESGVFDKILVYTDKDLPESILQHNLFKYKRGGGYWLWKPWVILQALKFASEGDIIFYSDCGNTLFKHPEWNRFFRQLNKSDYVLFYNGGKMKIWTKKELLKRFPNKISECYQIVSNAIFVKKNAQNRLIASWFKLMFESPEVVVDVPDDMLCHEDDCFKEHRHDQAVLSCLAYSADMRHYEKIKCLPQRTEMLRKGGQAIYISRISDSGRRSGLAYEPFCITLLKDVILRPYRRFNTWRRL